MLAVLSGITMAVVVTGFGLGSIYLIGAAIIVVGMLYYLNKVNKKEMDVTEIPILRIWAVALGTVFFVILFTLFYSNYFL